MAQLRRLLPERPVRNRREYEEAGGGRGLETALRLEPSEVIELIHLSGLRGRGGAGFPTGIKWRTIVQYASPVEPTPVVVNAAEGEPGTFKDRTLLRQNPYLVVEGALIAAYAIGSPRLVVAAKAGFDTELNRLTRAIEEMRAVRWLDGLEVEVVSGPSEYLFGEETGLLEVLEGRPPFPRVTPPWRRGLDPDPQLDDTKDVADVELASESGTQSAPALVDNVETLANVPLILAEGVEWFREVGTEKSPGTMLCTVTGGTARHGVGEFPLGTPLSEVIEEVGGGARDDHEIVAVLSGVANAPVPATLLDTPITYEDMALAGSALGSGSFIVIDDSVPVRQVAADVARFLSIESCGQCVPCKRDSLVIAAQLVGDDAVDVDLVTDRLSTVTDGARCALAGQTQATVRGFLALDPSMTATDGSAPYSARDADRAAIAPLLDIVDGEAVLDLGHRGKAADWTYDTQPGAVDLWPATRLSDQPVEIAPQPPTR